MKRSKTALAAFLAGAALLAGGAAAALDLPDQAADRAGQATTDAAEAKAAGQAKAAEAKADESDEADSDATETEAKEEESTEASTEGERPTDTHGYQVSTLATTTELEGREKGEEISSLAKTNGGGQANNSAEAKARSGK